MLLPVFEEQQQSQGLPVSKPVIESDYTVGENVRVKSGAFEGMDATVSEIKGESQQIVVMISVFGRDTPGDLELHRDRKDLTFLACEYEPRTSVWGSYFVVVA